METLLLNYKVSQGNYFNELEKFNLLSVEERRDLYALECLDKHVFTNTLLSETMQKLFVKRNSGRELRDGLSLEVPRLNTAFSQSSCNYQIIKLWSGLVFRFLMTLKKLNLCKFLTRC